MRRILVIPIMIIYLFAVSGIMVHAHYCEQQLESLGLYQQADGCEEDCGDKPGETDDCCDDKIVNVKITNDQNSVSSFLLKLTLTVAPLPNNSFNFASPEPGLVFSGKSATVHAANAPPGNWQSIPLYKLHSSFTYYG